MVRRFAILTNSKCSNFVKLSKRMHIRPHDKSSFEWILSNFIDGPVYHSYQGSFMRWSRESFEGERIKIRFLKLLILLIILCRNMRTIISVHDVFIFVHFSMLAQSRVWYITLSTDIARKRSFASMQANMSYQRWIAFEGFVAIFADQWPFIYRFLV